MNITIFSNQIKIHGNDHYNENVLKIIERFSDYIKVEIKDDDYYITAEKTFLYMMLFELSNDIDINLI